MVPFYGRKRLEEIKKLFEAREPLPFAGAHYFIVGIKWDSLTETGSFSVQQLRMVESESDNSVRDAVRANR
jgi:hypothetical protein